MFVFTVFFYVNIFIYISCVFISVDICVFRFDMKQRLICHLHRSEGWMGLSFVSLLWDHLLSQVVHLRLFSYTDDTAPFPCLPPSTKRLWGKNIVCERVAGDDSVASVIGEGLVWPSLSRVILTERACVAKRKMGLADWCWCECDRRAQWKSIYIYICFFSKKTYSVSRSVVGGTDIGATLGYADYEPTHVTLPWAEDVFIVLEAWLSCAGSSIRSLSDM